MPVLAETGQYIFEKLNAKTRNDNWRSGSSAESRIHKFFMKCGGLPTAATIACVDFPLANFFRLA
jgi:hypothetical protein